jgi:hypothetical protein
MCTLLYRRREIFRGCPMKNRKNKKVFFFLVALGFLLAFLWHQEAEYRSRIKEIRSTISKLEINIYLLKVRARALKDEMEMMNLSTTLKIKSIVEQWQKPFRSVALYLQPIKNYRDPGETNDIEFRQVSRGIFQ